MVHFSWKMVKLNRKRSSLKTKRTYINTFDYQQRSYNDTQGQEIIQHNTLNKIKGSIVSNSDEIESRKEVIESNIETKVEKAGSKKSYPEIVIYRNKKQNNVSTESNCVRPIINDDVCPNLYSSNADADVRSHLKPSDI